MPEYIVIIIGTTFAFFFILLLTRILGKKQIAQLTFFDYITGITFGNMAASLAIDTNMQPIDSIIGMVILEGSPTTLIKNGNIIEKIYGRLD